MIASIRQSLLVPTDAATAFSVFTRRFETWWPREYTWSQAALETIGITPHVDGMCFEIGPHGFRCDWGRVLTWNAPHRLVFAWQIGPHREPVPDPARASTVSVSFDERTPGTTEVTLIHDGFDRHGADAPMYRDALASQEGWPFILGRFAAALAENPGRD
jgi:uncharacterized protein YndB with AHSA1/START domain